MPIGQTKTVWLTGASGFIGTHVVAAMHNERSIRLVTSGRRDVDLGQLESVRAWLAHHRPDVVIHLAAAAAGSVALRSRPVHFGLANLRAAAGLLEATELGLIPRLVVAGSAGEYPRLTTLGEPPRGLRVGDLWRGPSAAGGYGMARRLISQWALDAAATAGTSAVVLVLPTVFGPGDGGAPPVDVDSLRALPSFAARMMRGGDVLHWGTGYEQRDFLHVHDAAAAFVAAIDAPVAGQRIHVTDGVPRAMASVAQAVAHCLGFRGQQSWRQRQEGVSESEDRVWLEPHGLSALGLAPRRHFDSALSEAVEDLRARLEQP